MEAGFANLRVGGCVSAVDHLRAELERSPFGQPVVREGPTSDPVGGFEHHDLKSGAHKSSGRRESRKPGANDDCVKPDWSLHRRTRIGASLLPSDDR
jgi:hypothetical protein